MPLQSIPSPAGFTRRRPRIATALAIAFLFPRIKGSSEEFTSTGPNLDRIIEVEAVEISQKVEYEGLLSRETRGSGLRRRADVIEFEDSPNLVARQIVASSSALPTTSAISPTASAVSPTDSIPTITPSSTMSDLTATSTNSLSSSSSAPSSSSTAIPAGYELPQPFDSTLGTNFSSTDCPSFFATFLADPDFVSCAPFSLLLGTSTGFFQAQRSPNSLLPYVLNASCSASIDTCSQLMDKYARQIKLQNTCGQDLSQGNPLATEALEGFQNYRLYREAGCQRSNSTEAPYCFVDASANSDPDGLYFYYLPEGTNLPSGTSATCDFCTQGLLSIYARYAVNSTLPISKTYSSGRSVAALACGPEFAPLVTKVTSSSTRVLTTNLCSPTLVLVALSLLFLLN